MSLEDIKKRFDGGVILYKDYYALVAVAEATSNYIHNAPLMPNDKLDASAWRKHMRESLAALEKE